MLKSIISIYKGNSKHPLNHNHQFAFIKRVLHWQINQLINPYPVVYPFLGSKLIVQKGMHGITGNIYNGLADFKEMSLLLHLLRKDDLFFDIGANCGTYSILASGCKRAVTYAFEPIKKTFEQISQNVKINNLEEYIKVFNFALGEKEGFVSFTNDLDTSNKIIDDTDGNFSDKKNTEQVIIKSLDGFLKEENPLLIKIDVEGHEKSVLNGAKKLLNNSSLKAIIIESNASISDFLKDYGFNKFDYDPFKRNLIPNNDLTNVPWGNLIFIRDPEFVQKRLSAAEKINVFDFSY